MSNIYLLLSSPKIEVAKQKYDHLKEIKLADSKPYNSDLEVDILIGEDFSWNFICNSFVGGDSRSIALLTSGHSSLISLHVMKIQSSIFSENKHFQSTMKKF